VKHKSIGLRLSAAYALSRIGETGAGVVVLAKGLEHPHRGVACAAADFLARIGPPAASAVPALLVAARHKDYHVKGAANEALKRIRAEKGGK
jgi:HEAT repeat protein